MRGDRPRLVKVRFQLEPNAWHGSSSETIWAEANRDGSFVVKNTPFYVYGISFNDVIAASASGDSEILDFTAKLFESGHSSYRVMLNCSRENERLSRAISELNKLGSFFEEGPGSMLAFDVPPAAKINEIYAIFEKYADEGLWDFEEAHYCKKS